MNLASLSLMNQRDLVKNREMTASELAQACYRQIERLNPTLNAFITVIPIDKGSESGLTGSLPLSGIPIAVKDIYETRGIRTTGGSRFFAEHVPTEDAF